MRWPVGGIQAPASKSTHPKVQHTHTRPRPSSLRPPNPKFSKVEAAKPSPRDVPTLPGEYLLGYNHPKLAGNELPPACTAQARAGPSLMRTGSYPGSLPSLWPLATCPGVITPYPAPSSSPSSQALGLKPQPCWGPLRHRTPGKRETQRTSQHARLTAPAAPRGGRCVPSCFPRARGRSSSPLSQGPQERAP